MARNIDLAHLRGAKASMPALNPGEEYLCTDTFEMFVGTSGGNQPIGIPVFSAAGVRKLSPHIVVDRITATGSTQTVTLAGSSAFTSATSYTCAVTDNIVKRTLTVVQNSGTSFTVSGCSSGDLITFICIGT